MTGRFASSSASSSLLLLLLFVGVTFQALAPAAATGFEVDSDKVGVGFLDGAGGINDSSTDADHSATTRIVGGDVANKSRYPYYTALFDFIPTVGGFVYFHGCGGSLIRDDVVITAAHCVQDLSSDYTELRAIVNFTSYDDLRYAQLKHVSKFVIHQNYDDLYTLNDIALLFLDSPVMGVTPIKLNTDIAVPTDGQLLKAIGFGATDGEGTNLADELMEVDLPKFNDKSCNGIYFDSLDATTMVCAGGYPEGVNKDTCGGDSGGPLSIAGDSPKNDVLVGITSYGFLNCSEAGIPGVYTRVSAFVDWIEETLSCINLNTCTSSPSSTPTVSVFPTVSISPTVAPPPPQYLPGPTATIVVSLQTDEYPEDLTLWFQNVCNGNLTILLDVNSDVLVAPKEMKNFSVSLSTGIYEFVLYDIYGDGIYDGHGHWSVVDARNSMILFHNDQFMGGFSDTSGRIIVGDGEDTCPDVLLPGPNATVDIFVFIVENAGGTSLGYRNLCNDVETQINSSTPMLEYTDHEFGLDLSTGEYEFFIRNSKGDSLFDGEFNGYWAIVLAGNVTHYENYLFVGMDDTSSSHLAIGSGCAGGSTSPSSGGVALLVVPTTTSPATSSTTKPPSTITPTQILTPTKPPRPAAASTSSSSPSTGPVLPVVVSSSSVAVMIKKPMWAQTSAALLWLTIVVAFW